MLHHYTWFSGGEQMVSIVVPAFNAEKYIERCIESVLKQTNSNFELIIVNDGSTDNTSNICRKLMQKCVNVQLIDQNNMGGSAARNNGLAKANGDWIVFLDSDDTLSPDYVEIIENESKKNIDFLLFDYATMNKSKKYYSGQTTAYEDKMLLIDCVMKKDKGVFKNASLNSPWAKAYKKEIIDSNDIKFDSSISMGEDILFNISYFFCIKKFLYISRCVYNYQVSQNSLARKYDQNLISVDKQFLVKLNDLMKKHKLDRLYESQLDLYAIDGYLSCLKRCLFHPHNLQSSKKRFEMAEKITNCTPYRDAIRNKVLVKRYCNRTDRMLLYMATQNRWNLLNSVIKGHYRFSQ